MPKTLTKDFAHSLIDFLYAKQGTRKEAAALQVLLSKERKLDELVNLGVEAAKGKRNDGGSVDNTQAKQKSKHSRGTHGRTRA